MDVIAISLWDTQEHAEAYNAAGYPEVLKSLNKVLDGAPSVRVSDVISFDPSQDRRRGVSRLSIWFGRQ